MSFTHKSSHFRQIPLCLLVLAALVAIGPQLFGQAGRLKTRFDRLGPNQGLSQVYVHCMLQDSKGFLWVGTEDGLNRYDGTGFKIFKNIPEDANSLSANKVLSIVEDKNGILWIGTYDGGLNRFDPDYETFDVYQNVPGDPESFNGGQIASLCLDEDGSIWLGTNRGLSRFFPETGKFKDYRGSLSEEDGGFSDEYISVVLRDRFGLLWVGTSLGLDRYDEEKGVFQNYPLVFPGGPGPTGIKTLFEDREGNLWIGCESGLARFDNQRRGFTYYTHQKDKENSLGDNKVSAIIEDQNGMLWVGNDKGLTAIDLENNRFHRFVHDVNEPTTLGASVVTCLLLDDSDVLWVGTFNGGLSKRRHNSEHFDYYNFNKNDPKSLSYSIVTSFLEDEQGSVWVGTYVGLNRFNPKDETFTRFLHDDNDPNSLVANDVYALCFDQAGYLWVGTLGGLDRFDPKTATFKHYPKKPAPHGPSYSSVAALKMDPDGYIWIGTYGLGLNRLDPRTETFKHFKSKKDDPTKLSNDLVNQLLLAPQGGLWVGTYSGGLNYLDTETEVFTRFENAKVPLNSNIVLALHVDKRGTLWVGTQGRGLSRMQGTRADPTNVVFINYGKKEGLADENVNGILSDSQGYLWLSTNRGISRFDPRTVEFKNYSVIDNLKITEFVAGAYYLSPEGRMYFGGVNGFHCFMPEDIEFNNRAPKVHITGFKVFQEEIALPSPLSALDEIVLDHNQSYITFEFAAMDFRAPEANLYAYKMTGLHNDWVDLGNQSEVSLPYMPPGEFTFQVKASNNEGVWNEEGASIKVHINPPIWKTNLAYVIYALFIILAVAGYLRSHARKLRRERLTAQRLQLANDRLKDVNRMKDQFLANTSHELRTPLNGIVGLTESLLDGAAGELNQKLESDLSMIVSSGKRLASLVNDILDFSKLKSHALELYRKPIQLHALVNHVLVLSSPLIGDKNLKLVNDVPKDLPLLDADENRLQQVLHNLVGNGIKFTEQGTVTVRASEENNMVTIVVADTGIGIPSDSFERIFQSFEQVDGSMSRTFGGTGLGLAVTKHLIELHGGAIWVESIEGEGACFNFTVPISSEKEVAPTEVIGESSTFYPAVDLAGGEKLPVVKPPQGLDFEAPQHRLLLVDDEPINLRVLVNYLAKEPYELTLAKNGEEALQLIEDPGNFDLMLLDIMMPRMSGYEVCRRLRQKYEPGVLPILLLTAKVQESDLVEGFEVGANDFLRKPISKGELLSRIRTHIKLLEASRALALINQKLEEKVKLRTQDLQFKNQELREKHEAFMAAQKQLIQAEKMAALGGLVAGIAHEINTPIGIGVTAASLLKEKTGFLVRDYRKQRMTEKEFQEYLEVSDSTSNLLLSNLEKAASLVQSFKQVAVDQSSGQKRKFKVKSYLEEILISLAPKLKKTRHRIEIDCRGDIEIFSYAGEFSQIITNLVINSLVHGFEKDEAGVININVDYKDDKLTLIYKDNGIGIEPAHLKKVFDPFFTTKRGMGGSGLGLHIIYNLVTQKLNGEIDCRSDVGKGVAFTIEFPV